MTATARASARQGVRPGRAPAAPDPTHYPVEKKMGEHTLQRWIVELLRPLIERWFAQQGKPRFVGADQFIYYRQHDATSVVAPDVYVMPGAKPGVPVPSWKTWETGAVPTFALEVVSAEDPYKDYVEVQDRYRDLGAREVVIFDPFCDRSPDRVRWQRWRRTEKRGFALVESTNADRLQSRTLGCWLRVVGEGSDARLRLATGPAGDELFPTAEEAARDAEQAARTAEQAARDAEQAARAAEQAARAAEQAARAAEQVARAAEGVERAEKEAERAEKEAALRHVAELEALLAAKSR